MKIFIISFFLILFTPFSFSVDSTKIIKDPLVTLRTAIDNTLKTINENQKAIQNNPEVLHDIITKQIQQLFDLNLISRFLLAQYYLEATRNERIRFTQEFTRSIVYTYSKLLFSARDIDIRYKNPVYKKETEATIKTIISFRRKHRYNNIESVPVNYKVILLGHIWKIRSLSYKNIGLVVYRNHFS